MKQPKFAHLLPLRLRQWCEILQKWKHWINLCQEDREMVRIKIVSQFHVQIFFLNWNQKAGEVLPTIRIGYPCHLKSIRISQISIGRRDRQDDAGLMLNVGQDHSSNACFNVRGLVPNRHFCNARQINQRNVQHIWRKYLQPNLLLGDSFICPQLPFRFRLHHKSHPNQTAI